MRKVTAPQVEDSRSIDTRMAFGHGVRLRTGQLGRWYCAFHRPHGDTPWISSPQFAKSKEAERDEDFERLKKRGELCRQILWQRKKSVLLRYLTDVSSSLVFGNMSAKAPRIRKNTLLTGGTVFGSILMKMATSINWLGAVLEELNREQTERFYADLVKFASGEPNEIREGTIGEIQAKIAKRLAENDPDLLRPEHRKRPWAMSTDFVTEKKICASEVFDGRLEQFGVREHVCESTTHKEKYFTDGRNCLWVYIDENGYLDQLTRRGANAPTKILRAIATAFDTEIFSEYEPQFWGFNTQEEWDAALEELNREQTERFYADLVKFASGEPNEIREGTIGEIQAKIAKRLAENDPDLLRPEHRKRLMKTVEAIYDRDHAVKVKLSDTDLAIAHMLATHEDDMGQA
jgi:hypothetical protein